MGPSLARGWILFPLHSIETEAGTVIKKKLKLTNYATLTMSVSRCPKMYLVRGQTLEVCFSFLVSVHGGMSHFLVYIADCCDWPTKENAGRGKKNRVHLI